MSGGEQDAWQGDHDEEVALLGGERYRLRYTLGRDASYTMLTDDGRTVAYHLAAGWRADQESHEPMFVAEHYHLGDRRGSLPPEARPPPRDRDRAIDHRAPPVTAGRPQI